MGMGLATAGIGLYQTIKGSKEKRDAQKMLEAYQRQQLQNQAENLRVSTLGADLQREEQARLASAQVDALQGGGTRALVGGLGRTESGNQAVNEQIAANLDEQQIANDRERMNEEIRIRGMQESRENADIEALSSQYQAGKNDMNMGIGNTIQGLGSVQNTIDAENLLKAAMLPKNQKSGEILPQGAFNNNNSLSTGVMTPSGGSGMGAVSGFGFDEFGNKIAQPTNTALAPKKKRFGLGYNENYDGTLNFN